MKQDPKETAIKELFQQLKEEDEGHAPAFADVYAAARDHREGRLARPRNWLRWSLVAAASILIASGFIAYNKIHNDPPEGKLSIKEDDSAPVAPVKHESEAAKSAVGPVRRRRLRAPRPRRGNRTKIETSSIPDHIIAEVKENEDTTDFISLRYGDDNKPMESGDLIRVLMPRSALITLGLPVNVVRADEPVLADLLIGEDGLARAIRFVR